VLKHALILAAGLLVTACAALPVGGPTAPSDDPAAGKLTLPSGRSVWVYPHDLVFSGEAGYQWPAGQNYQGDWEQGKPHGMGTMQLNNGERFSGMWEHGQRHGHGELTQSNGHHYVGQFVAGVRQGDGVEHSSDGLYRGAWRADLPNGQGEFHANDGSSYQGQWRDGQRQGFGRFTDDNGSTYEGDWIADAPHGFGNLSSADGSHYHGRWSQGSRDGYGNATDTSELDYTGTWVAGQRQGFGIVTRPDGSHYQGDWLKNQRQGQGRETSGDGSFHDGGWENNQPFGPGTRRDSTGIEISGVWNGDQVSTGLLALPTGPEFAGSLFKNHNKQASLQLQRWLEQVADRGDPYAQLFLGTLYSDFNEPAPDVDQARGWFAKAAQAGLAEAQYRLALTYTQHNVPRTIELLDQAAVQDHPKANDLLGEYYLSGDQVPRNLETAVRYFERAMAAGSVEARNNLAWILATTTNRELRDGARALSLIRPIALLYDNWQYLDTLAAAYAEIGDFDQAIATQRRAMADLAHVGGEETAKVTQMQEQLQQRLHGFQRHEPARE
jgi:TPR repeat protein